MWDEHHFLIHQLKPISTHFSNRDHKTTQSPQHLPNSRHCSHNFPTPQLLQFREQTLCPLCRNHFRLDKTNSSPQDPQPMVGSEEDFAVIELSGEDGNGGLASRQQERVHLISRFLAQPRSRSSRKIEQNVGKSKPRQFQHVSIMGDEDVQISVQPIRRSFSIDSAVDRRVYSGQKQ